MCGFVGVFGFCEKQKPPSELLGHRGPDAFRVFEDEVILMAHNRLAIIDLDMRSVQPMKSSTGRYKIIFNGEIYNFKSLKKELEGKGIVFTTESDTEVIVNGFEVEGEDWFKRLEGMFALAIYDINNKSVTLARDRFGIKPLYYSVMNGVIYFASEQRGIKYFLPNTNNMISVSGFTDYFHFGYVNEPSSWLSDIKQLSPGTVLTKSLAEKEVLTKFYSFPFPDVKKHETVGQEEISKKVRNLVIQSIDKHFVSDAPISVLLSSGLDSNIIAHVASKELGYRPMCYTARFEMGQEKDDESNIAQVSANAAGLEHRIIDISADNLTSTIEKLVECYEEPFADPAGLPIYLISQEIRKNAKVVLQGDGGDEFFGGYSRYHRLTAARWYRHFASGFYALRHFAKFDPVLYKKFRFFGCFRAKSDSEFLANLMTSEPYEFDYMSLFQEDFRSFFSKEQSISTYSRNLPEFSGNYSLSELSAYVDKNVILPSCYLRKVDRATMAFGLESRIPFLDNEIAEFMSTLPMNSMLGPKNESKFLLKMAFKDILPDFILRGSKKGFTVPISEWLRGPLYDYTSDKFQKFDNIFSNTVLDLLNSHKNKKQNHSFILWKLLIFSIWMEKNEEKQKESFHTRSPCI